MLCEEKVPTSAVDSVEYQEQKNYKYMKKCSRQRFSLEGALTVLVLSLMLSNVLEARTWMTDHSNANSRDVDYSRPAQLSHFKPTKKLFST